MKYIEVEQKYRLLSPPGDLRATLAGRGGKRGEPARQVDTYYNSPHRDFLAGEVVSEWLRIREGDDGASVNFKLFHPVGVPVPTHCDEYESAVGDAEAVRRILAALGFTRLTVVDKVREEWAADDIAVAFDTVAGLGDFVEFEFKGEAGGVEEATARIEEFIADLGVRLGDRILIGYPHMALGLA